MRNTLSNKTVLITGGSSGIGQSLAKGIFKEGARVGIISRRSPLRWEKPMAKSWDASENWIEADFNNFRLLQKHLEEWLHTVNDSVDVLIHCAVTYGSKSRHTFEATTISEWDELFSVNTKAPFIITKTILPCMEKDNNGLIIGFVSDVVFAPGPGRIGYSASKSAFHSMMIGLAEEKRNTNIRVIEVLPKDQVHTPGIQNRRSPGYDFSAYTSPDVFIQPIISIINSTDDKLHGACIIVDKEGQFYTSTNEKVL